MNNIYVYMKSWYKLSVILSDYVTSWLEFMAQWHDSMVWFYSILTHASVVCHSQNLSHGIRHLWPARNVHANVRVFCGLGQERCGPQPERVSSDQHVSCQCWSAAVLKDEWKWIWRLALNKYILHAGFQALGHLHWSHHRPQPLCTNVTVLSLRHCTEFWFRKAKD